MLRRVSLMTSRVPMNSPTQSANTASQNHPSNRSCASCCCNRRERPAWRTCRSTSTSSRRAGSHGRPRASMPVSVRYRWWSAANTSCCPPAHGSTRTDRSNRAGCCGRWRAVLHLAVGQIAKSTALSYTCTTSTRCQHTHAHQPLATRGVRQPYRTTAGLA